MNKKRYLLTLTSIIFLGVAILIATPMLREWKAKAEDSAGRSVILTAAVYLDTHFKEFGEYPDTDSLTKHSTELPNQKLITSKHASQNLPAEHTPLLTKSEYRLVVGNLDKYGNLRSYWILIPSGTPEYFLTPENTRE